MREPQDGASQIGRFEWWIEKSQSGERVLYIQCLEYDSVCYPSLSFVEWGMTPSEVSESEIEVVFAYVKTAAALQIEEEDHQKFFERVLGGSFSNALSRAKELRSALERLLCLQ